MVSGATYRWVVLLGLSTTAAGCTTIIVPGSSSGSGSASTGASSAGSECTVCGTACVDASADPHNCGACGHDCLGGGCADSMCQQVVIASVVEPDRIVMDDTSVYWTSGTGTVSKAPIAAGSTIVMASGPTPTTGLAVDEGLLYWGDASGVIHVVSKQGGAPSLLASDTGHPERLLLRDGFLYWASAGGQKGVGRVPVGGGTAEVIAAGGAIGLAVDATNVYWSGLGEVNKAPIGGGAPTTLANAETGAAGPSPAVVVDADFVYFSANFDAKRVPIAGGDVVTLDKGPHAALGDIVLDATHVYWAAMHSIRVIPLNGGSPKALVTISDDESQIGAMAANSSHICWTTFGGSTFSPSSSVACVAK